MKELFATICLAGAIQSLLLCVVLLVKRNNRAANRFLAVFMAFLAVDAFELYLLGRGHLASFRPYALSVIPYSLVFGPSIFLYVVLLTSRLRDFSKKHLLWYAPFAVVLAVNLLLVHFFDDPRWREAVVYADMIISGAGLVVEGVLYIASLTILRGYIGRLKDYFSAIDALKLSFIRGALVFLVLVVLLIFLSLVMEGAAGRENRLLDVIAVLVSVIFGFAVAVTAMLQPEIFNRVRLMEEAAPAGGDASGPRYDKFRLTLPEEENHVKKLVRHMEEHRPYLREELTLQDLADALELSPQHVSMLLNIHLKQNFYTFINGYRVGEVKRKLADPHYGEQSILSIAYDAGFNSKTAFNAMFKKLTGKTPRQFRVDPS